MRSGLDRARTRLMTNLVGLMAMSAAVVACSPGASLTLSSSPSSTTVVPGGTIEIAVTLVRNGGAAGDVSLSAAATSGLSFSFSPAVLSGGATSSTLTVTAAPSAALGARQVQLSASGAGLSATAALDLQVELLTVAGTVVGFYGQPIAGATLYIAGLAPTTSAADGTFSIAGVTLPYDLTVAFGTQAANTYLGLTTASPSVASYAAVLVPPALPRATVSGDLTGTWSPIPAGHRAIICPEGIGQAVLADAQSCTVLSAGSTSYSLDLMWFEGSESSVRLRTYLYTLTGGVVDGIAASAVTTLDVIDGGAHVQDIALVTGTPPLADLQVSFTAPVGYSGGVQVVTSLASGRSFTGDFSSGVTSPATPIAPLLSGASYTLLVSANGAGNSQSGAWRTGVKSGDNISVNLPTGPSFIAPADGVTGVNLNTTFSATNPVGGSLHFIFGPHVASDTLFIVSTMGTSIKLPDLSAIGLGLVSTENYSFQLIGTPETETADDMVAGDGYMGRYLEVLRASVGGPAPTRDGAVYIGSGGTFTAQ